MTAGLASSRGRPRYQVPATGGQQLWRADLLERMDFASDRVGAKVVLVCAPAGYGKTTLLAQWARTHLAAGQPVAWLSCDGRDSELPPLLSGIRYAFAHALAGTPAEQRLLSVADPGVGGVDSMLDQLAAILVELGWIGLVLDGPQMREGVLDHESLTVVAEALPENVHMMVAARSSQHAPIQAARLAGWLSDIGPDDLAFTAEQVSQLLELAGLDTEPDLAERLTARTEGWPAAVRLAIMSWERERRLLDRTGVPPGARPTLAGLSFVADYLADEVLASLPTPSRLLLEDTSVVPAINASLAAELSGRPDAGNVLDELARALAFVRRGEGPDCWYVVHGLLREHLQAALGRRDSAAPARQQVRAAQWYRRHGMAATALGYAVAAGDRDLVVDILADDGLALALSGSVTELDSALTWLGPTRWSGELPGLAALCRLEEGNPAEALRCLAVAEPNHEGFDTGVPTLNQIALVATNGFLPTAAVGSKLEAALSAMQGWPGTAAELTAPDRAMLVLLVRGRRAFAAGDPAAADADLGRAVALARSQRRDRLALQCLGTLAGVRAVSADSLGTAQFVENVLDLIRERGWALHPAISNLYAAGAWAAHTMLRPKQAHEFAELAVAASANAVDPEYVGAATLIKLTCALDLPDQRAEAATALAALTLPRSGPLANRSLRAFALVNRVLLLLALGEVRDAVLAVGRIELEFPGSVEAAAMRAWVAATRSDWPTAAAQAAAMNRIKARSLVPNAVVLGHLADFLAQEHRGMPARAREALEAALDNAATRSAARPFYDAGPAIRSALIARLGRLGRHEEFVTTVLDRWLDAEAFGGQSESRPAVRLSRNELLVLRELPSRLTLDQIARERGVATNTVKTQVRGIYRKLEVSSRQEAVSRARELGLLRH